MDFLRIFMASAACWGLGAIYYGILSKPWLAAIGKSADEIDQKDMTPFILSAIAQIICVTMMNYLFWLAVIDDAIHGALLGAGIGAFIVSAWVFIHNAYEGKPMRLSVINTGYATLGLGAAGAILGGF